MATTGAMAADINQYQELKESECSPFYYSIKKDRYADDKIELDIYYYNSVFNLTGMVIQKTKCYSRNEYGIQIVYNNKNTIYTTKDFLDKLLVSEKELLLRHLLNA